MCGMMGTRGALSSEVVLELDSQASSSPVPRTTRPPAGRRPAAPWGRNIIYYCLLLCYNIIIVEYSSSLMLYGMITMITSGSTSSAHHGQRKQDEVVVGRG